MPLKTALRWLHFSSLVVYRTITWAILGGAFAFALTVLVDLITAQRNFQANAKAIETSTALTQSIIQIRN